MTYKNMTDKPVVREIPFEEIDGETGAELRGHLMRGERVHPASNELQFRKRFSSASEDISRENHCFGVYAPGQSKPSAVVYVKLMKLHKPKRLEDSAQGMVKQLFRKLGVKNIPDKELPGDIMSILRGENRPIDQPDTAIFYSISSFSKIDRKLLNDMNTGEFLIKGAARILSEKNISTFSTLSPLRQHNKMKGPDDEEARFIRAYIEAIGDEDIDRETLGLVGEQRLGFRPWLEHRLHVSPDPQNYFTKSEIKTISRLADELHYQPDTFAGGDFGDKFLWVAKHQLRLSHQDRAALHQIIRALALDYLLSVPRLRNDEMDPVEDFHIRNGAKLGNIHVKNPVETGTREWESAFGVMVNYVYELEPSKLQSRKAAFNNGSVSPLGGEEKPDRRIAANGDLLAEYRSRQATLQREHGVGFAERLKAERELLDDAALTVD